MATHAAPLTREASKTIQRWLRARAKLASRPLGIAKALGMLDGLGLIVQTWLMAQVLIAVLTGGAGLAAVWPKLVILPGIFLLRAAFAMGAAIAASEAAARVKHDLRTLLHGRLEALRTHAARGAGSGALTNLLVEGVDALDGYYSAYLPQMSVTAFLPVAILAVTLPTDWISGVVMIVSAPLIPLFMIVVGRGAEQLNQTQWRKLARLSAHLFDVVEGITTIRLFDASRREAAVLAKLSDEYRETTMAVLRVAFLSSLVLEFFATISIAMIAVYVGFRLYAGALHFLPGLFVLLLAPEFYRPLRNMGTQYHARMEAIASAERIIPFLDAFEPGEAAVLPDGGASLATVDLVQIENLRFGHDTDAPILDGVDLTLARGEIVALTGPSGAGKTSFARLLLGLARPDGGRILANGTDLRLVPREDWFARVAWMPQNPTLFAGTLRDNIRLARPDATDAEIHAAAASAHADRFIDRLPLGYDTVVGDRGQGLSGGEIRRVALARMFLKPADLVVLDEPTASLDDAVAAEVMAAIMRLAQDRAVLVIAHRAESIACADRVVALENGRFVAQDRGAALRVLQDGALA